MRRAARVDANHSQIVKTIRSLGVQVTDLSGTGKGVPDLLCMWRGGITLIEVKDGDKSPFRRKLTVEQVRFHEEARIAGVHIHVVISVAEALAVFGGRVQ